MGKKSKSKSKSAARIKLPKEVAGVKVPKGLRKQAKSLITLIDSPVGRELAAAGLTLAAARLSAGSSERRKTIAGSKPLAPQAMKGESDSSADRDAADLAAILSAAVAEGAKRFLAGFEEGQKSQSQDPPEPSPSRRNARRQSVGDQGDDPA